MLAMIERDPELAAPLVAGLPYLRAEAVYAARYEMARTVDDVLTRRTRARLLARDASAAAAADVAAPHRPRARLDADRAASARSTPTAPSSTSERDGRQLPETALDQLHRRP